MKLPKLSSVFLFAIAVAWSGNERISAVAPTAWNASNVVVGTGSMNVYAKVLGTNGVPIQDTNSLLAAFSSNALVGVVNSSAGPSNSVLYALQVFGATNTDLINYKFYNSSNGVTYLITTNSTYTENGQIGTIFSPVILRCISSQLSQQIGAFTPIAGKNYLSAPFAITPPIASSTLPVTVTVKSGLASISSNMVTILGAGTVVLAANQPGNNIYLAAPQVTTNFIVAKGSQSITFPGISSQSFTTNPISITLPTASSPLPVNLSVSGPAKLSGSLLTLTGAGSVVLTASQSGNSNYLAATPVTNRVTVSNASQTISPFNQIADQIATNAPFIVTPPVASSGLNVTVSVSSGPATILTNMVTLTGSGTVTLSANQGGNTNYLAASTVTTSFAVSAAPQTIAEFTTISTKTYATTKSFAIVPPASSSKLAVVVKVLSGPATIAGNTVTLTGKGTVVLAANQAGNAKFQPAAQVTTSFTVQ
jgi:hypothetical protein